jgi:two-component system, OmpR family, sensor histidine kinase MtrB
VRRQPLTLGLRSSTTLAFALLALVVSTILALGTYLTARHYLIEQREQTASRQSFVDASFVRDGLLTSGADVSEVLDSASPPKGAVLLVERAGRWYSSSLNEGAELVPPGLLEQVQAGRSALTWGQLDDAPAVMVGAPMPAVGAQFFEVTPTLELDSTLTTLATVLGFFALLTTVGGAAIGRAAAARVVAPLDHIATAAANIAAGEMGTRLPATSDPDLAVIVGSFNTMVEALDERIRRDARFAADVSHELRSPVTTMLTSVEVLTAQQGDLPERSQQSIALVGTEVRRLHRSLEHLLELGRLDAGVAVRDATVLDLRELVRNALAQSHRSISLGGDGTRSALVLADKQLLHRALVNLFDNADQHGAGLAAVSVEVAQECAQVYVVDHGKGVAEEERERIFERFARSGARGSRPGSGLGLSLVAETARAHGGVVWCEGSPGGGATFVISLPLATAPAGKDGP